MQTKILIVEDEAITAMDLQKTLESMDIKVVSTVASGEEAIKKAGDLKPDLIIMDVMIQGEIDGIEAAIEIQNLFNIPVVYLTAYSDKDTIERVKLTKPYGFLTKPVSTEGLKAAVDTALYKHKLDKKLAESEEKLRTIFEVIPVGISILDGNRNLIYNNPALGNILGLTEEELAEGIYVQRNYLSSDGTEIPLDKFPSMEALKEQKPIKDTEIGIIKKDNSIIWVNVSAIPLQFPDWKILTVTSDITKVKQK